jgi:hypothetical protein
MKTKQESDGQAIYHIRVSGGLDPSWSVWFEHFAITRDGEATLLSGPVRDQADLRGILNRLWDLNLVLDSVARAAAEPGREDER